MPFVLPVSPALNLRRAAPFPGHLDDAATATFPLLRDSPATVIPHQGRFEAIAIYATA